MLQWFYDSLVKWSGDSKARTCFVVAGIGFGPGLVGLALLPFLVGRSDTVRIAAATTIGVVGCVVGFLLLPVSRPGREHQFLEPELERRGMPSHLVKTARSTATYASVFGLVLATIVVIQISGL